MDEKCFKREYYGACEGGHAATVLTEGLPKKEDVIAFVEKSTCLSGGWNVHHLVQRNPGTIAWVLKRVIKEDKYAKRRRH